MPIHAARVRIGQPISNLSLVFKYGQVLVDTRLTKALCNYKVALLEVLYWALLLMMT